jgi:hypothetical protein
VLLVPADDSFVEDFHVAITVFMENAIGQTGQVMGARSIKHNRAVSRNTLEIVLEFRQRCGKRAQDMHFAKFFGAAHIYDDRLGATF